MTDKTTRSILCDNCQKELIEYTPYPAIYRLELKAIDTNINTTGASYAMYCDPPIDRTKHFCGFACLSEWMPDQ